MTANRRRVRVGVTLDAELVASVDAYVTANQGMDRTAVIDEALWLWFQRRQDAAMERQLRGDTSRRNAERADWKRIRMAAARRRFGEKVPEST